MTTISDKVILVDIDGVVLDWNNPFTKWVTETKGYVRNSNAIAYDITQNFNITSYEEADALYREFNNHYAWNLPPTHGSLKWMPRIHEEFGFKFHAVTKMGRNIFCMRNRLDNLQMYGDIWVDIDFFENHECKKEVLGAEPYLNSGCFWVEDLMSNARQGHECGLTPILMENPWNIDDHDDDVTKVSSWADVYHMLNTNN